MLDIVCCLLIADFITGVIHWFEDTYGLPTWPILGPHVIEPNIQHHEHPGWIGTMSNLISRNYQSVVPAIAVAGGLLYYGHWQVALTLSFAAFGNEVHTWCHRSGNNWLITFLQESGIVQHPRQHAKHHHRPYDKYYCTLTNVVNEILEPLGFWRKLEFVILKLFGVQVKRISEERRGW